MDIYNQGQRDFGENYVEEMVKKSEELPKDINWHFIGHLQSNKINKILEVKNLSIQTIDSQKLAEKLNQKLLNKNR